MKPLRVPWRKRLALAALVLASVGVGAAQGNFVPAPGSPYSTDNEPYGVSLGAFNGDSLTDLAVVNGTTSTVQIFDQLANDNGFGLAAGSGFNVASGPNFAAVADYNGDTRPDIAVSSYVAPDVGIFLQQPNGTFTQEAGSPINVGGGGAQAVASSDFNGDGKQDLAVALYNGFVAIILRKADNTGFMAPSNYAVGGPANPQTRFVAVGDLDGSGGPDVALTNSNTDLVSVLLDQGAATSFTPAPGSPYAVDDQPQFAVVAPLDGDSLPDIAVSNRGSGTVSVLDRSGGTFVPESGSPYAVGANPVGLAAADFDGSGHLDLVSANAGTNTFTILKNTGSTFTRGADVPIAPASSPFGIATGQLNSSDSLPDVAVTSVLSADAVSVFLNKPPSQATTLDATGITDTSATLNATVNPQGLDTDAHFEYGTTTAYGSLAPAGGELAAGSDRADHTVSRDVAGLSPSTTYHFRVVSSSGGGTVTGADKSFATPATPPPPTHDGTVKPPVSTGSGPPQAYLSVPTTIAAGTPTTLSAEGSSPVGSIVSYKLDLDGSGTFATDLKTSRSLSTTFTTPGDIKVGLRVTDAVGRVDTVRRTVKVTAPPVFGFSYKPDKPKAGDKVRFSIRQLLPDPTKPGVTVSRGLADGSTATMTYGDDTPTSMTVDGVFYRGRAASGDGDFTHAYAKSGNYKAHISVDDGNGYQTSLDAVIPIDTSNTYQPSIATAATTVEQGSCVSFTNSTGTQLARQDTGPPISIDINPVHQIIQIKPDLTQLTAFGGEPGFLTQPVDFTLLKTSVFTSGSVFGQIALPNLDVGAIGASGFRGGSKLRQVEPTVTYSGADACAQWQGMQSAVDNAKATKAPYPKGADKGWPAIKSCPTQPRLTYAENPISANGVTKVASYTRFGWFSVNQWDFGDGTKSGTEGYIPSSTEYHPYDKPGNYTVKLTTTFPEDLAHQLDDWNNGCTSKPLDPLKPDDRFITRSTQLQLHVKAHYDRIKMRGLSMTSGAHYFEETDYPGVYESSGPIYINTRRLGPTRDSHGDIDFSDNVADANGVLVVTPQNGPLSVVPDQGEIIGAANIAWQSNNQQLALGPMPTTIKGTPGLIVPPDSGGGVHDFGIFKDPPASLGAGGQPAKGGPFHINTAHPVLRENKGGTIDINVHMPPPMGPNGQGADQTITIKSASKGRAHHGRGLLDNIDVDLPAFELVPDVVSFNGGKLSHHVSQNPPWQATGSLTILKTKVDMSPDSKKAGCPVVGGLGFYEDGGLASAGAVVQGLKIPLPNPPEPEPVSMLTDPALQIIPGTSKTPLDLFGCLTYADYPDASAFQIVGCAGFLLAGSGIAIPDSANVKFCPDQNGNDNFVRNDHNSTTQGAPPGTRLMRGFVVRVSGDLGLGPKHYTIARAYLEVRSDPFSIEARGHFGQDFLDGHVKVAVDVFGYINGPKDWAIGGEGGVTQDLICVPLTDICPGSGISALVGYKGIGACARIYSIGIGGSVTFADLGIHPHFPGCDLQDLKHDLGVSVRQLPRYSDMLSLRGDPIAATSQVQTSKVALPGSAPYALIVVNGAGQSPVVEVRDPDGKLVLDDSGAAVQGLPAPTKAPKEVDLATQDPPDPAEPPKDAPQGILHNELTQYHDADVDLRHTTMIMVRDPKQGQYTVTAKPGSAAITAISHSVALATPNIKTAVVKSLKEQQASNARKVQQELLTINAKIPAGSSMTISEQTAKLNQVIATIGGARLASASPYATVARVSKHVRFRPALGPAGRRKLVAVISRDGIPQERMVIGSYKAPAAPKAGRVRKLKAKRHGSRLTLTWRPAANAKHYEIRLALKHGVKIVKSAGAKAHKLVIREPLARLGATVTVRAVGPLSVPGPTAKRKIRAAHVKRIKHFVL